MKTDAYGNLSLHPSVVLTDADGSVLIDFTAPDDPTLGQVSLSAITIM